MLRDMGAQGADVIRLWPAVAGAAGKPSQLHFALKRAADSRQQEGIGPVAAFSTPLLVQAQPLPEAPAHTPAQVLGWLAYDNVCSRWSDAQLRTVPCALVVHKQSMRSASHTCTQLALHRRAPLRSRPGLMPAAAKGRSRGSDPSAPMLPAAV